MCDFTGLVGRSVLLEKATTEQVQNIVFFQPCVNWREECGVLVYIESVQRREILGQQHQYYPPVDGDGAYIESFFGVEAIRRGRESSKLLYTNVPMYYSLLLRCCSVGSVPKHKAHEFPQSNELLYYSRGKSAAKSSSKLSLISLPISLLYIAIALQHASSCWFVQLSPHSWEKMEAGITLAKLYRGESVQSRSSMQHWQYRSQYGIKGKNQQPRLQHTH